MSKVAAAWIIVGGLIFGLLACWYKRPSWISDRVLRVLISLVFGSLVLAVCYTIFGIPWRHEKSSGQADIPPHGWRVIARQIYNHPDGQVGQPGEDGCNTASGRYKSQTFIIRLESCRDYTAQFGYEAQPHRVGAEYYLTADVTYVSGPHDGYCAVLTGWQDNEHYYAFKLGLDAFQITRDKGGVPHQRIADPKVVPEIFSDKPNRVTILVEGGQTSLFINGLNVAKIDDLDSTSGKTMLAAQAANNSDLVECQFDNVELRAP